MTAYTVALTHTLHAYYMTTCTHSSLPRMGPLVVLRTVAAYRSLT